MGAVGIGVDEDVIADVTTGTRRLVAKVGVEVDIAGAENDGRGGGWQGVGEKSEGRKSKVEREPSPSSLRSATPPAEGSIPRLAPGEGLVYVRDMR